jgi:NTP pyrophosphatase (non-canonical NTP hydrolase)
MDIREAQDLMRRIYLARDRARGVERTLLRTFHELGELSDAIMKGNNCEHIESEMADVFAWVCSTANLLDLDLAQALTAKYGNGCSRCRHTPCDCTDTP